MSERPSGNGGPGRPRPPRLGDVATTATVHDGGCIVRRSNVLVGQWRIVEIDLWDRDANDLVGPAIIEITAAAAARSVHRREGFIDARRVDLDGRPAVEVSRTATTKGTKCQAEGGPVWTRMARCVATSSSTPVTTLASRGRR